MIDIAVGKPLQKTAGLCSNDCRWSTTLPTGGPWVRDYRLTVRLRMQLPRQMVHSKLCAVRCGRVMVIEQVVVACPVSRDVVFIFGVRCGCGNVSPHIVVFGVDVLAGTTPVHRSQASRRLPLHVNTAGQCRQLRRRYRQSLLLGNV